MKPTIAFWSLFVVLPVFGQGFVIWDESVDGPLSENGSIAAVGTFQSGTNSILGTTEYFNGVTYGDYFTFVVPAPNRVTMLLFSTDRPVAVWFGTPNFATEYGYTINPTAGDLLAQWGLNSIAAGQYGMSVQSHEPGQLVSAANYRLDFVVQAVPEPGALSLAAIGSGLLGVARRKMIHRNG